MKPITLKMQAFGSYSKETVIDFGKTTQNLFLVYGDTGAGKTTIFDAMVFALYGEASSGNNKKNGEELQSQFASIDVEPYVELTFMEKDDTYVVKRIPRHLRAKKKARGDSNETLDKEKVSLIMPDLSEYPEKEADKKIEEIVGLTKPQFMQVAMIAQGEFMEMLRAKSDDKKDIFRKLFDTGLYENIVREFARRLSDKKTEMAQIRTICQTEVGHIKTDEAFEGAEELNLAKKDFMNLEAFSVTKMELILTKLTELCEHIKIELNKEDQENEKLLNLWKEKNNHYKEGQQLLQRFQELEQAKQVLKELEEKQEEIQKLIKLSQEIQKAYDIKVFFDRFQDQNSNVIKIENLLSTKKAELPSIEEDYKDLLTKEKESNLFFNEKNALYLSEKVKVEKAIEIFDKKKEAESRKKLLADSLKIKEKALEQKQSEYENFLKEEIAKQEELASLKNVDAEYNSWQLKNKELTEMEKEIDEACDTKEDYEAQLIKAQKASIKYINASKEYEIENEVYEKKRKTFLNMQAGILAKALVEGEPCMVCGSKVHPSPYKLEEEEEELTQEALDELHNIVEDLRKTQESASINSNKEKAVLEEKEKIHTQKINSLVDRMINLKLENAKENITFEEANAIYNDFKLKIDKEGTEIIKKKKELSVIEEFMEKAVTTKTEINQALDVAKNEKAEIETEVSKAEEALKTLESQLDYKSREEAVESEQASQDSMLEAKDKHDLDIQKLELALSKKQEAETLISNYEKELPTAKAENEKRKADYEETISKQAMEETIWQHIVENHRKSEVEVISKQVNDFNEKKNQAEGEIKSAKAATLDKELPNIEKLKADADEIETKKEASDEKLSELSSLQKTNGEVLKNLNSQYETRAAVIEETSRIETLYKLLSGNVKGARMDIETYVQRVYLERILQAANLRFQEMSSGQFELRMYDLDKAGEGKNHGLDLMVYSNVTGKVREVRTLSGGESFMAALSLALGMADQIQENSGAINLDVMFIDEGFGSLDDHSRNQAIKVLKRMADTSKLIGIISHVTELKQEIDDLLIVEKDERGSKVRWINS